MTFQDILLDAFCKYKEEISMIYNDISFTYKDIYVMTCQLVKEIEGSCLEEEYVAIYCKENFYAALSLLACWLSGAIPVPIDYYLSKERLDTYFRCIPIAGVIIDESEETLYSGVNYISLIELYRSFLYNTNIRNSKKKG